MKTTLLLGITSFTFTQWTTQATSSRRYNTRNDNFGYSKLNLNKFRGGSTEVQIATDEHVLEEDVNGNIAKRKEEEYKVLRWRLEQQHLLQIRSVYLTEVLAQRGISIPTVSSVATLDGERAEPVDWQCAMSTKNNPKPCLYSFDAQVGTKVVAPKNTDQWISLGALNRLRRMDPTKVEPMWHSKYAIREAWFGESEFSMMQHVGIQGWAISTLLDHKLLLKTVLMLTLGVLALVFMPVIEYIVSRFMVSGVLWGAYKTWGRFANAALPFKLLMVQMLAKFLAGRLDALESIVRNYIVEMECALLEETVPVTVENDEGLDSMTDENDALGSVSDYGEEAEEESEKDSDGYDDSDDDHESSDYSDSDEYD